MPAALIRVMVMMMDGTIIIVYLSTMRKLKFHEQKLLKKVNFYDWKV